jgi:hypothetical protein
VKATADVLLGAMPDSTASAPAQALVVPKER